MLDFDINLPASQLDSEIGLFIPSRTLRARLVAAESLSRYNAWLNKTVAEPAALRLRLVVSGTCAVRVRDKLLRDQTIADWFHTDYPNLPLHQPLKLVPVLVDASDPRIDQLLEAAADPFRDIDPFRL